MSDMNAYELARIADVVSPDSLTSPGAQWLLAVAQSAPELTDEDDISETADAMVPIYTHERWRVFVDLAAYGEDVSDYGPIEDMTQAAGVALYMIAERLLTELVQEQEERYPIYWERETEPTITYV